MCFCFLGFFLAGDFLGLLVFCSFPGFLSVRKVRNFLGVFEVFLGIFEKTKEKNEREFLDLVSFFSDDELLWGVLTILCKIITNDITNSTYLRDYSYSFQRSSELMSVTVTVSLLF